MSMSETITVRGEGRMSLKPDTVELTAVLSSGEMMNYSAVVKAAEAQITALREALAREGFEKDALKTADMNVNSEYEYRASKKGESSRVFVGYSLRHTLVLSFPMDPVLIDKAFAAATESMSEPELSLCFTVRDKSQVRSGLLRLCAEDAKKSAGALAAALGVSLGAIKEVRCDVPASDICSGTVVRAKLSANARADGFNAVPQDIEVSESAVFTWEIKQ